MPEKKKNSFCTLLTAVCCLPFFLSTAYCQLPPMGLGDSLFLAGSYYPASVEYERAAFLSSDNRMRTLSLLRKADCYKQLENFQEAEKNTERINYAGLNDTLMTEAHFQSALCSYLSGNFANAENHLVQMHSFIKDSSLLSNTYPLYALVLNELKRWPEAKEKSLTAVNASAAAPSEKDSLRKKINALYLEKNYPELKNLLKAQKMSAFLPGLGQLYAGYFWEGAASAFLNVASVGLMGYCIYTKLYFTGIIAGSSVFSKFYLGGSNRLEYLVGKKNYRLLRSYNNRLKDQITEIQ